MATQQRDGSGISAVALLDYQAKDAEEISFFANDVITDIELNNAFVVEEWWQGWCKGQYGLFPANCVQLLGDAESPLPLEESMLSSPCAGLSKKEIYTSQCEINLSENVYQPLENQSSHEDPSQCLSKQFETLYLSCQEYSQSYEESYRNQDAQNFLKEKDFLIEHQSSFDYPIQDSPISHEDVSLPSEESTLSRKESYRHQHKKYLEEKKRLTQEHRSSLIDPTLAVHANWLRVRGLVKKWTKLWCVLKPGMLLIYKTKEAKNSDWIGTVLLNYCKLMKRPSKIEGYSFTLFHPYNESIWAKRGPDGKAKKYPFRLLPATELILNVPSVAERQVWMNALGTAIQSSSLMGSTLSLLSLPGLAEASKTEDDGDHFSFQEKSEEEQESGYFASEFEEESQDLNIEDNLEEIEYYRYDESPSTSSGEEEIVDELGEKKMEQPKKYVSSLVNRFEKKIQKDTHWENFKSRADNRLENLKIRKDNLVERVKTKKDNNWESLKSSTDNLVERVKPHFKHRKNSNTVQTSHTRQKKKVYIMNYIKFPNRIMYHFGHKLILDLRKGATKDSKNLGMTFGNLGYDVILRENMTIEETNDFLDNIEKDGSLDFLLLFVLSHGLDEDTFILSDGHQYSLRKIQYRFTDKKCPHLRGKSKIILSNFCRGIFEENLEKLLFDSPPVMNETPHNMITIHASHEGFKAGRTEKRGTLFVHNLCEVLKENNELQIQDLFNKIYDKMAKDIGQTPKMEVSAPFANFVF